MKKNCFVLMLGAILFALSFSARAQQPTTVYRVGILTAGSGLGITDEAFRRGMRQLGYIKGQNLIIEWRLAEGKLDRLPGLAADLARLKVDVIIVSSTQGALAAKQVTQTIPIVFAVADDPVESGLVVSLAHPNGNATGLTDFAGDLSGKRLELLKEASPNLTRLALLVWKPDGPGNATEKNEIESAAQLLGVKVQPLEVKGANDLASSFSVMAKVGTNAFMALTDTRFSGNRHQVVELSAKRRLPAIYPDRQFADAGGLMSYGTNRGEWRQHITYYTDRILKGAKPSDLPVERPTKFEFIVNLKAAKQIGMTIHPTCWRERIG